MQRVSNLEHLVLAAPASLAIGGFDGVHLGHQALIGAMVKKAHAAGQAAVVLTFFPHPAVVLRGPQQSFYLTTPDEKAEYVAKLGVDALVTHPFSQEVAAIRASDFVQRLVDHAGMRELWCGPDFALGNKREGTVDFLRARGAEHGFSVQVVPPLELDGQVVSSTRIRQALREGQVEEAARLLGRPFRASGSVVKGAQRGRQLGIPTANMAIWDEHVVPAVGVYACRAHTAAGARQAVVNIGFRPTFEGGEARPVVEAHLLDFAGDLYDSQVQLEFIARLRPEMKFSGVEALLVQIKQDIVRARQLLAPAFVTPVPRA